MFKKIRQIKNKVVAVVVLAALMLNPFPGITMLRVSAAEASNGYGNALVAMARSELDSYVPYTAGSRYWAGYANYTGKYFSADTAWCVCFIYYCAEQCGFLSPEGKGCFGSDWFIDCGSMWNYFLERDLIHYTMDYLPTPGDVVFYGTESSDPINPTTIAHVGIVEYIDNTGSLITIEGNNNNSLNRCTYSSYEIGTYAFGQSYILGYASPSYPGVTLDKPVYSYVPGLMRPWDTARIIGSGVYSTVMAGPTRLAGSELAAFINKIPKLDRDLAEKKSIQDLISAVNNEGEGYLLSIVGAWNAAVEECGEKLLDLQVRYTVDSHISQIHQAAYSRSGFDWLQSDVRKQILWTISTCTIESDGAGLVLASIAANLTNEATDTEVILAYHEWLPFVTSAFRYDLWPSYDHDTVELWIDSLNDFGMALDYLNSEPIITQEEP